MSKNVSDPFFAFSLRHEFQYRGVMQRASRDDAQVPDPVPVAEAMVEHEEHDADGVDDAARHEQQEAVGAQRLA